jgi:hypothetical protein
MFPTMNTRRRLCSMGLGGCISFLKTPFCCHLLDGLFSTYFAHTSRKTLNQKLDLLYQNKPLMIQASIAFIVIFLSFLNDSNYYVSGISAEGIAPT